MKEKYELHMDGEIFESDNLSELKKITEDKPHPYEIYLIKQSKMNSGRYHTRKLDDIDIEKILRLIAKGQPKTALAKLYHVDLSTLNRAIASYDNQYKTRVTI